MCSSVDNLIYWICGWQFGIFLHWENQSSSFFHLTKLLEYWQHWMCKLWVEWLSVCACVNSRYILFYTLLHLLQVSVQLSYTWKTLWFGSQQFNNWLWPTTHTRYQQNKLQLKSVKGLLSVSYRARKTSQLKYEHDNQLLLVKDTWLKEVHNSTHLLYQHTGILFIKLTAFLCQLFQPQ